MSRRSGLDQQVASLTTAVLAALEQVRDPELDEPITALGFVAACSTSALGDAIVRLRLPTYFCAPNFAYLMVADAHDAVSAVPGVSHTAIILDDHFASETINEGVAAGTGFVGTFDGLAESELDQLRVDFLRKAVLAATDRVCRPLLVPGGTVEHLAEWTLADAPPSAERERLRSRRTELGLPGDDNSPLVIDPFTGMGVERAQLSLHLRKARLTRVSAEANRELCGGLLRERYPALHVRPHAQPT